MTSAREQLFQYVFEKLETVAQGLGWPTCERNPEERIAPHQMPAMVMMDGGEPDPIGLSGHVERNEAEFTVILFAVDSNLAGSRAQLDAGWVAVSDTLLDPADIQLGQRAESIRRRGISDPVYGRAERGAHRMAAQSFDFSITYLEREGDASSFGP